jgi:hypothetical protein
LNWKATYIDGSELNQFENGREITYYKIDQNRLKFFDLIDGEKTVLRLHIFGGRKLIYRRRVMIHQQSGEQEVLYLVGWQKNINGENVQSIAYVHEDGGTILISGSFNELPEPYSSPI